MRKKRDSILFINGASSKRDPIYFLKVGMILVLWNILGIIYFYYYFFTWYFFDIVSLPADVYGSAKLILFRFKKIQETIVVGSIVIILLSSFYPASRATK